MNLRHQLKLMHHLLSFFNQSYSLTYCILTLCLSILFVIFYLAVETPENFFFSHAQEHIIPTSCAFAYIEAPEKYRSQLQTPIHTLFSHSKSIFYISKEEYDAVQNQTEDLLYVDGCPVVFLVKEAIELSEDSSIKVTLSLDMITPVKKVTNYDPRVYYSHNGRTRMQSILHTTFMEILKIVLSRPIDISLQEEYFYENFGHYYLLHMGLPTKLVFIICAFAVSPLQMMFLFKRDMRSRFVDTIRTKGVSLFQYLFIQFTWSFMATHILVVAIVFGALALDLELMYSPTMILSLLAGMLLLSYDMHISANLLAMLLKNTTALVISWLFFFPLSYQIVVSYFDPFTSIDVYFYPVLLYVQPFLYFLPGYPFEAFTMALAEHSSRVRINFAQMYSIESPFTALNIFAVLSYYLIVNVIKTVICLVIFRYRLDNIYERPRLCVRSPKVSKRIKTDSSGHTKDNSDSSRQTRINKSMDKTDTAIILSNVCKKLSSNEANLKNVSLNIKYNHVTVVYSVSEFECMNALCKLCAGYYRPDSGTVSTFPYKDNPARIGYIITRNFLFEMLTVHEYMYLFGRIQQGSDQSELVFNAATGKLLLFLRLKGVEHRKASELSRLEQVKLSIAFALLGRSNVLLFDMPSFALNLDEKRELWSLLLNLSNQRSVFLTTNSIEEADFVADNLYILQNGAIQFQGSTEALRRKSTGNFVLRFSRRSQMSDEEIEKLLEPSDKLGLKLRESTISELVYVFNCDNEEHQEETMTLLDKLMKKVRARQLVMNELSMNTLDDQLVPQLLADEEKNNDGHKVKTDAKKALKEVTREASSRAISCNDTPMTFLEQLQVMMWKRLLIGCHNKYIFIVALLVALIMDLMPWGLSQMYLHVGQQYVLATDDMLSQGYVSVKLMQKETEPCLRSYCELEEFNGPSRCEVLGQNQSYQEWIYSGANTFHEYGQKYLYSYSVDQYNETKFQVTVFMNEYSKRAKAFGIMHFMSHLVSKIAHVNFSIKFNSRVHYLEGSNLLEMLFVIVLMSNIYLVLFMFLSFLSYRVPNTELNSGMRLMQLANGVRLSAYSLSNNVAFIIYSTAVYLTSFHLQLLLNRFNPISFASQENYVWYSILVLSCSAFGALLAQFLMPFGMTCVMISFFIIILIKNCSYLLIFFGGGMSTGWFIALNELMNIVSVFNLVTMSIESLMLRVYDISLSIDNATILGKQYDYYWNVSPWRGVIQLWIVCAIFFYIITKTRFWQYQWYKYKERKGGFIKLVFDRDFGILKEDATIEEKVKKGTWPSDAAFIVHKLSKFSKRKFIDQISFVVRQGQCFGLLGLKSSAKSDLLLIFAGQSVFDDGNFYLNKFDDQKKSPFKQIDGIAYAPQYNCAHEMITVEEMLMLFARIKRVKKQHIQAEVSRVGSIFKLQYEMHKRGGQLSSLSKRALTLAMAFIGGPQVVLLDEPTHQVKVTSKHVIWDMIKVARAVYKPTIVMASKDIDEIESLADRVAVLIQGGLHYIGSVTELREKYCTGIQIHLKMKPAKCQDIRKLQQIRRAICQALPGIRSIVMHKYYMYYFLRQATKGHSNAVKWSTIFERLEKLRAEFDFEAYTVSIGSLEQIFYSFSKKHRAIAGMTGIFGNSSETDQQ